MQTTSTHIETEVITSGLGAVGAMVAGGTGALKHVCAVLPRHVARSSILTVQVLALVTAGTCRFVDERRKGFERGRHGRRQASVEQ